MERLKLYILESYNELVHKVTWPSWASLQSSAVLVIVASVVFALFVLVMDVVSKLSTDFIYGL